MSGSSPVAATQGQTQWKEGEIEIASQIESDSSRSVSFSCGSDVLKVRVAYEPELQKACVYGEPGGLRLARYVNNRGVILMLAAYPSDDAFYAIRGLCADTWSCVYSQFSDTVLFRTQVGVYSSEMRAIDNISRHLDRRFDPLILGYYYEINEQVSRSFIKEGEVPLPVGRMGVSRDGRWVAAEYVNRGVVRIDMKTEDKRRIFPLSKPSIGSVRYEFAVSSDGKTVAFSSEKTNPRIINVDDTCGDRVVEASTPSFPPHIRGCSSAYPKTYDEFEQYRFAVTPYFISDDRLYLHVHTQVDAWDVIYAPSVTVHNGATVDYIALGDSFTSGEGEIDDNFYLPGTNQRPHTCHVSSRSYPYLISYAAVPLNMACSGATIEDIAGGRGYTGQGRRVAPLSQSQREAVRQQAKQENRQGIVPQIDFLHKYQPRYATVGIGGNDAGFMGKLKSCIAPGTCHWAQAGVVRQAVAQEIDSLYEKYTTLFEVLKRASPKTHIKSVGYPQIISHEKTAACGTLLGTLLSYDERVFIARSITRINTVMQRAALDAGLEYVSVENAYENTRLCDNTKTPAMNGLRLGDDISPIAALPSLRIIGAESFHPTPFGHTRVARLVSDAHQHTTSTIFSVMTDPSHDSGDTEYWSEGVDPNDSKTFRYYQFEATAFELPTDTKIYEDIIPAGVFAPNSKVVLTLQGSKDEAELVAAEDGSLEVSLTVSDLSDTGMGAVFLTGVSNSNEDITAYRMIATGTISSHPSETQTGSSPKAPKKPSKRKGDQVSQNKAHSVHPVQKTAILSAATPLLRSVGSVTRLPQGASKVAGVSHSPRLEKKEKSEDSKTMLRPEIIFIGLTSLAVGGIGLSALFMYRNSKRGQ